MKVTVRLAVRDWDYLTPLLLGDIQPKAFNLEIDRVESLEGDLASSMRYDGGEVSFSRYTQAMVKGDQRLFALPHFLMRGFRQRCIITCKESPLTHLSELKGKRIGLTGWQDSGNTWTRTLLQEAGVGIDDARWFVGRLADNHPIIDRLNGFGRSGRIEAAPQERPLLALLQEGSLDAIFTPFMPQGFFAKDSDLRQLQQDFRQAELEYAARVGYVPGIHLLAFKQSFVEAHPEIPAMVSALLDESTALWLQKREKYADTTPWLLDDLRRTTQDLPTHWNANGLAANRKMIADFCTQMFAQGLIATEVTPEALFKSSI